MAVNKISSYRIDEILEKISSAKTKAEKINLLREYNTLALRNVLKGAFDDAIQFMLPEGNPPFREANQNTPPSSLRKQSPRFRYFVVGGPGERMPKLKIESMFVKLLEAIPPSEAKVVLLMKDKKLETEYKGINKKLVQEAFPGLITK
jgi:hypothetical protein